MGMVQAQCWHPQLNSGAEVVCHNTSNLHHKLHSSKCYNNLLHTTICTDSFSLNPSITPCTSCKEIKRHAIDPANCPSSTVQPPQVTCTSMKTLPTHKHKSHDVPTSSPQPSSPNPQRHRVEASCAITKNSVSNRISYTQSLSSQ